MVLALPRPAHKPSNRLRPHSIWRRKQWQEIFAGAERRHVLCMHLRKMMVTRQRGHLLGCRPQEWWQCVEEEASEELGYFLLRPYIERPTEVFGGRGQGRERVGFAVTTGSRPGWQIGLWNIAVKSNERTWIDT